jgi:hypothetical protein
MSKKDINTDGAAYIGGKINTGGGKIYPKDHVVYGDKVGGDKFKGNKIVITVNDETNDTPEQNVDMSGLPDGAILSPDFVGGRMHRDGKTYRLMQPVTKRNGLFVYVPV